ncbi:hypothetical protein [Nocardia amamiensis]|uniref:hypothetical protein n=1 Tax=Nocardia amamiensis TaxID=404578 RepID=UPI0008318358|nr:hypothetical protein [Nocardia amamiensis]
MRVDKLSGIGHVIGARLVECADKVASVVGEKKLMPVSAELRGAAERHVAADMEGNRLIRRAPDDWTLPDGSPRPISGMPIRGTDLYGRELSFWTGDVSKDVLYGWGDVFWGVSYPLAGADIPYLRGMPLGPGNVKFRYTHLTSSQAENRVTPWDSGDEVFFVHAEADAKTGRFYIRADVEPFDRTNPEPEPGGEVMALEPEMFARVVANDPDLRREVGKHPASPIAVLSGGQSHGDVGGRFAAALQQEEGFLRDVYFANGTQIAWLKPPAGWESLSIQPPGGPTESLSAAWTRYPVTSGDSP